MKKSDSKKDFASRAKNFENKMQQSFVNSKKSSKKMTMTSSKKLSSKPIKEGMQNAKSELRMGELKEDSLTRKKQDLERKSSSSISKGLVRLADSLEKRPKLTSKEEGQMKIDKSQVKNSLASSRKNRSSLLGDKSRTSNSKGAVSGKKDVLHKIRELYKSSEKKFGH